MPQSSASSVVGLVLGSQDATPLDDGVEVTFYGIVDIVRILV